MSVIRRGDSGVAVADIRARLVRLSLIDVDPDRATASLDDDVEFDHDVEQAVRTFQQQRGIPVDGIVGPQTLRHLDEVLGYAVAVLETHRQSAHGIDVALFGGLATPDGGFNWVGDGADTFVI